MPGRLYPDRLGDCPPHEIFVNWTHMNPAPNYKLFFNSSMNGAGGFLLQSILAQNPDFFAGGPSPLLEGLALFRQVYWERGFSRDRIPDFSPITTQAFSSTTEAMLYSFYEKTAKPYVMHKDSSLALRLLDFLKTYVKDLKLAVCLRDLRAVACSAIGERDKGSLGEQSLKEAVRKILLDERTAFFMEALEILCNSGSLKGIFILRYEDLCGSPVATMRLLYDYLEVEWFKHDFTALCPLPEESFFYGEKSPDCIRPVLEERRYDYEKILGREISRGIIEDNFWYYKNFYPEVLYTDPERILDRNTTIVR